MELHDFLEEDILVFLDTKLLAEGPAGAKNAPAMRDDEVAAAFLNRDYEHELFDALRAHDLPRAKRILHEVKDDFASYPEDSLERRQLKVLLHSLYEKFKEFLDEESTLEHLERAIDDSDARIAISGSASHRTTSSHPLLPSSPPSLLTQPSFSKMSPSDGTATNEAVTPAVADARVTPRTPALPARSPQSPALAPAEKISPPPPAASPAVPHDENPSAQAPLLHFFEKELLLRHALQHRDANAARTAYVEAKRAFATLDRASQQQHRGRMLQYHALLSAPLKTPSSLARVSSDVQPKSARVLPGPAAAIPSSVSSPGLAPPSVPASSLLRATAPLPSVAGTALSSPVGKTIVHDPALPEGSELLTYHEKRLTRQRP